MGNNANSTYHALQVEFEKRFSHGWVYQGNYTWSKALGESEGTAQTYDTHYRNPTEPQLRQAPHDLQPHPCLQEQRHLGPAGRPGQDAAAATANRVVDGVLGGWKLSGILTCDLGPAVHGDRSDRHLHQVHRRATRRT